MRTYWIIINFVLISVLFLQTGCSPNKSFRAGQNTLRIGYISQAGAEMGGAEGWALKTGTLQKSLKPFGITNVIAVPIPSGPEINQFIAAGEIDVASHGDTPAVIGRSVGLHTRLLAVDEGGGASRGKKKAVVGRSIAIIVLKDGPKTIKDLRGKKVGCGRGNSTERFLVGVLDINHVTDQVERVHIGDGQILEAALNAKDVDAICTNRRAIAESHGYRVLANANDYPQLAQTGVTVVTEKFLDAHPNFPQEWQQARILWVKDLLAHQDEYYANLAAKARIPVKLYKKLYPIQAYAPDSMAPEALDRLKGSKDFLLRTKLIKNDFSIDEWRADRKK